MRQLKVAAGALGLSSCFITLLMYYWHRSSLVENRLFYNSKDNSSEEALVGTKVPLKDLYRNDILHEVQDSSLQERQATNTLDTPGCKIPMDMIDFSMTLSKRKEQQTCGERAVFLMKMDGDKVHVLIKSKIIKKYLRRSTHFDCCARFFQVSSRFQYNIQYTACTKIFNGINIKLETDFVNVNCYEYDQRKVSYLVYSDVYAFAKKIIIPNIKHNDCGSKYNVLMLGMDSMSRHRMMQTMPKTTKFLDKNSWIGFKGYHKIGDNTFPNLMAVLSGKNMTDLSKCSGKMDLCNKLLIWSTFKENGYVTAYGEDYLRLPDTFSNMHAFQDSPTEHYMRPFFLKGETELNNKSLVCRGKISSGQQLLNYAFDFANTYRNDRFFGVFWMNSFSHNVNSHPQYADEIFKNFFNQLSYSGVLENTFVIFFSDHGVRFGELRFKAESYYDERLPFLYIWYPGRFKDRNPNEYVASTINKHRLVTHYDLYNTLMKIHQMSICSNFTTSFSSGCPHCHSVFQTVSAERTCKEVNIHEKWCSCHRLLPLDTVNANVKKIVSYVVSHINNMTNSVKTEHCWSCMTLHLEKIIRSSFYYSGVNASLHYVVAFSMNPGNVSYEATVLKTQNNLEIVGPVSFISLYKGLGRCTVQQKYRLFCVCQKLLKC